MPIFNKNIPISQYWQKMYIEIDENIAYRLGKKYSYFLKLL